MTCAKQVVRCVLILPSGQAFTGTNACANPQTVCPRLPGEGYEKCKSICHQGGHAELEAIKAARAAGADLRGGTAMVSGHNYLCQHCQVSLGECGIHNFRILP